MTINVNVFLHGDGPVISTISTKLDEVVQLLTNQNKEITKMSATLDDALAEVQRQGTIEDSMEALLKTIEAEVTAAAGDQTKIQAVFDGLKANNDRAAAAIVANTPAGTPPVG